MVGDKKRLQRLRALVSHAKETWQIYTRRNVYDIFAHFFAISIISFTVFILRVFIFSVLSMHVERDLVNIVKFFSFKRANSETRSKNNFQEKFIIIDPREISYFRRYAEHRYSNSTVVKRENNFQKTHQFYMEKRVITNFVYLFIIRTDS